MVIFAVFGVPLRRKASKLLSVALKTGEGEPEPEVDE